MKKSLLAILICLLFLSGCRDIGSTADNATDMSSDERILAPAILSQNIQAIKEAALRDENLDEICIGAEIVNPIVYSLELEQGCNEAVIECLLQLGADPNWVSRDGNTLLMYAMGASGYLYDRSDVLISLLLQYGADISSPVNGGLSALDYGLLHNGLGVSGLQALLDHGASISADSIANALAFDKKDVFPDSESCVYLHTLFHAAPAETLQAVDPFLRAVVMGDSAQAIACYAAENDTIKHNRQWLSYTAAFCKIEAVQACSGDILPSLSDDEKRQMMLTAVRLGEKEVVLYLLDTLKFNQDDLSFFLETGVRYDNIAAIEALCENGADLNQYEPSADFPWERFNNIMCYVGQSGDVRIIPLLKQIGYPMDNGDAIYHVAMEAAKYGNTNVLSYLYPDGTIPSYEETGDLLQIACGGGYLDMVQYLFSRGYQAKDLSRCLESAVMSGEQALVAYLIKHGADASDISLAGVIRSGNWEMLQYLLDNGANVSYRDETGCTAILIAAKCPSVQVVRLLLDNGADVIDKDTAGRTPLVLAESSATSSLFVVQELKSAGENK